AAQTGAPTARVTAAKRESRRRDMMHLLWFGPIGLAMTLLGRTDPSQQPCPRARLFIRVTAPVGPPRAHRIARPPSVRVWHRERPLTDTAAPPHHETESSGQAQLQLEQGPFDPVIQGDGEGPLSEGLKESF